MAPYTQVLNAHPGRRLAGEIQDALAWSDRADFAVSFVRMTGLQLLLPRMKAFTQRGAKLRVLTSTYMDVTEPQALRSLLSQREVETRLIAPTDAGFHSKAYLFAAAGGREQAWVGSSNLTKGGLSTNLEWNLSTRDAGGCREARAHFDGLWELKTSAALTEDLIRAYDQARQSRIVLPSAMPMAAEAFDGPWVPNRLQVEALAGLERVRRDGATRALVIAATGIGKTLLAAFDAQHVGARKLLFVAHRKDILVQAEHAFRSVLGYAPRDACLLFDAQPPAGQPFVFATTQTLHGLAKRDHALLKTRFDYVVVDEFHHANAPSWREVLNEIRAGFLLGLTATPERTDGRDILELCDFNVAYEVRLPQAIEQKILIPFHYFGIPDEGLSEEKIPWRNGRFDPEALEKELALPKRVENLIANAEEKGFDGPKRVAIGFCQSEKHARYMQAQFELRKIPAEVLVGNDERETRDAIYRRLQDPRDPLEWLFVVDLLNEGVDLPAINVIAMLRPTESMSLFLQQLGRGLRKSPGTEVLTVLDFVGTHRKAFLPLEALNDPAGVVVGRTPAERALGVAAPPFSEFLLEDKTLEILTTIKARTRTRKDKAKESYLAIKDELRHPPRPIDFWGRADQLSFQEVRDAYGSWRKARIDLGDAAEWERAIEDDSAVDRLLSASERVWKGGAVRVTTYAAFSAALDDPKDLMRGYARFFSDHPHWSVERDASSSEESLRERLTSDLPKECWSGRTFTPSVQKALRDPEVRKSIWDRVLATLAEDHRRRHGGVLRTPESLRLFGLYSRPDAVNHFGLQYDPARHNTGFFRVADRQFVIFIKLDTSGAKQAHQYANALRSDRRRVDWTSQNQMRRDRGAGAEVAEQTDRENRLFLFVQARSHEGGVYLGEVHVESVRDDAPMRVVLRLPEVVPAHVAAQLGVS